MWNIKSIRVKALVRSMFYTFIILLVMLCGFGSVYIYGYMDTEYSPSYSEKNLVAIKEGATVSDVLSALGEPLERKRYKREGDRWEEYFFYSRQGENKRANYYMRIVVLDEDGKVKRIIRDIFVE